MPSSRSKPNRIIGFTLIELLVVIAIIAILTAIIFPVFATMRENARQKTSMSNLESIQRGLAQFKLDQGRYPGVLFGYVYRDPNTGQAIRMDQALAQAQAAGVAAQYFPGLYPEYVTDPVSFTDENNTVHDFTKTTKDVGGPLPVNSLVKDTSDPSGQTYNLVQVTQQPPPPASGVVTDFYLADAYDISPEIDGQNSNRFLPSSSNPAYVVRYQLSWTDISAATAKKYSDYVAANPTSDNNYARQLRWANPPADTYVTCTTHHVPNDNRVLVLWESGSAKSMDASRFLAGAAGGNLNPPADSPGVAGANFWQVSPTNNANPGP
ncbi:MAG: prepilin-type N-terminal cleavage/methylation domain-containing protein [Armatimonadetes bacterium]|nr:prepilin-type N-terminal cleavage/methylation domain-containing protein [Armatimonadota bacterium]